MKINKIKQQGFTIVELLIVIVVIGILAAITIVAYNGIQNRAKTTQAKTVANAAVKKAELFNTDTSSGYPTACSQLTTAAATTLYQLTGALCDTSLLSSTNLPQNPTEINFISCGASVGAKIGYWDYSSTSIKYVYAGTASASTVAGNCIAGGGTPT